MISRLTDVLEGREGNFTIPLFWLKGESEERIRHMVRKVRESGIRALCIESRPHPDFLGPKWWKDVDTVMAEASRLEMKVWLFDDSHFPTGYVAGRVAAEHPDLRKWYLKNVAVDALGPAPGRHILVSPHLRDDDRLVAALAWRRDRESDHLLGEPVVLTDRVTAGRIYWDVPEGFWRVFLMVQTRSGGEERTKDYLNPIDPAGTDVLIDTVYAPHYERYKKEVGTTFAGFFSDEPRLGNASRFSHAIGRTDMVLPWRDDMLEILSDGWGAEFASMLPLLRHEDGRMHPTARRHFMEIVSRLYSEHFSCRIGDWCRERGLEYIGHILEDNNVHARLGWGNGHFFRAMAGQDMAGIDLVLQQLRPGMDSRQSSYAGGPCDGEFYHYALGKLGSSMGHLYPRAKGRTFCEVFGAFGWVFGLRSMRWMVDHLAVRGVNHFMPHAFTCHDFPDPDCPPHMYGEGRNPQFRFFGRLVSYMNRLGHLLSGGRHVAPAAVLYHAEAEWGGECMLFQKPVKVLLQNQIDCDIVPADALLGEGRPAGAEDYAESRPVAAACGAPTAATPQAEIGEAGRLRIGNEEFSCLVVPWAAYLPASILASLRRLADGGVPLFFLQSFPSVSDPGFELHGWLEALDGLATVAVVELDELAESLRRSGHADVRTSSPLPWLRYCRYTHGEVSLYLLFNEDPHDAARTELIVSREEYWAAFDAMENTLVPVAAGMIGDGESVLPIELAPGEPAIFVGGPREKLEALVARSGDIGVGNPEKARPGGAGHPFSSEVQGDRGVQVFERPWQVWLPHGKSGKTQGDQSTEPASRVGSEDDGSEFTFWREILQLLDLSRPEHLPAFSGTIRYECSFTLAGGDASGGEGAAGFTPTIDTILDLGEVHETAEVTVNGRHVGVRMSPPYRIRVGTYLRPGENTLRIEVTNTVVKTVPDRFSAVVMQDPTGLLGPVRLLRVQ